MDNYGMAMYGSLLFEKVSIVPDWGSGDVGRIIYDLDTENYYLGAPDIETGYNGWIPIGIISNSIKSYNIDWDENLTGSTGKVSASNVPVSYDSTSTNVQVAVDLIHDAIVDLSKGTDIQDQAITADHLKVTGADAVTADVIPITNTDGYFSGTIKTIEDALNELAQMTAADVSLDTTSGTFGKDLSFTSTTVQEALEALEDYLSTVTATQIPCTYEGCGCATNVQFAINALYNLHAQMKLVDLVDVPAYDAAKFFLKSNGTNSVSWTSITSNDIVTQFPGQTSTNAQAAFWAIEATLTSIQNQLNSLHFTAEDIEYNKSDFDQFNNVDDALDYILNQFYYPGRLPSASIIPCTAIGETTNTTVQLALAYLNNEVNSLLSLIPCEVKAADVPYTSPSGATNVSAALDYIFSFIIYARQNCDCCNGFGAFTPTTSTTSTTGS